MPSTMKVIQVTIDEPLLAALDRAAACDGKARSVLIRDAVERMLRKRHFEEAERRVIESYRENPQDLSEIEAWAEIQDRGEERTRARSGGAVSAHRTANVQSSSSPGTASFRGSTRSLFPITTKLRGVDARVPLDETDELHEQSEVNLLALQTVPKRQIGRRITTLRPERMREINAAIALCLGFDLYE